MIKHELKIWPRYFERVRDGSKTFEVRKNDRDFQAGDFLELREYDPEKPIHEAYTGRRLEFTIGYVLALPHFVPVPMGEPETVVLSLLPPKEES